MPEGSSAVEIIDSLGDQVVKVIGPFNGWMGLVALALIVAGIFAWRYKRK